MSGPPPSNACSRSEFARPTCALVLKISGVVAPGGAGFLAAKQVRQRAFAWLHGPAGPEEAEDLAELLVALWGPNLLEGRRS